MFIYGSSANAVAVVVKKSNAVAVLVKKWFVHLNYDVSVFSPRGVTPTSKFVCVLPFPDGDARRHKDLSWFGQEKALRSAGEGGLYYLAPKCLYRV